MKSIRILNPSATGARFTSMQAAERLVSRGHARWDGSSIRLVEDHPVIAANNSALGYDRHNGVLSRYQVQGIPVIMPERLMMRTSMYSSTRWLQAMRTRNG